MSTNQRPVNTITAQDTWKKLKAKQPERFLRFAQKYGEAFHRAINGEKMGRPDAN